MNNKSPGAGLRVFLCGYKCQQKCQQSYFRMQQDTKRYGMVYRLKRLCYKGLRQVTKSYYQPHKTTPTLKATGSNPAGHTLTSSVENKAFEGFFFCLVLTVIFTKCQQKVSTILSVKRKNAVMLVILMADEEAEYHRESEEKPRDEVVLTNAYMSHSFIHILLCMAYFQQNATSEAFHTSDDNLSICVTEVA